jgi:hypothetical protein
MKRTFKSKNPNKLYDELVNAGIIPVMVWSDIKKGDYIADNVKIDFTDDTDMELVQQIVDAHDPTPLPAPKTELEILQETVDMLVLSSLGVL